MQKKVILFIFLVFSLSNCIVEMEPLISTDSAMLLRYNFQETGPPTALDSSIYGNNGNISGTLTNLTYNVLTQGRTSYNWRNNSTVPYSYIRVNTPTAIHNISTALSITGWLYHNVAPAGVNIILAKVQAVNGFRSYYVQMNVNILQFGIWASNAAGVTSTVASTALPLAAWVFFAVTYKYVQNGTSIMNIYINGGLNNEITNATGPIFMTPTVPVTIGSDLDATGGLPTANRYRGGAAIGGIDDLRLYSKALTPTEIANIYNGL